MKINPKKKKNSTSLNSYAKYSSIAFQMVAIILLGVFGGIQLDKLVKLEFPLFTVLLSVLAVIFSIYYVIHDLLKMK
jgi:F0F1-type ATP synthase assembly protein I